MTMKKFYLLALMAMVAISCHREVEKELVINATPIDESFAIGDSSVIPVGEALKNLDELLDDLYVGTRSADKPSYSINNILTYTIPDATRSTATIELPDTLVYMVQFDDNNGYAVLGARSGISPVLSVIESGNLNLEKFSQAIEYEIENNILTREEYLRMLEQLNEEEENMCEYDANPEDMAYALTANVLIGDLVNGVIIDTPTSDIPDPNIGYPGITSIEQVVSYDILENCQPLTKTQWRQRSPFNLLCKVGNQYCPVGCTVTAVAQIMACNKYPKDEEFNGVVVRWDTVLEYDPSNYSFDNYDIDLETDSIANQLSNLCYELGKQSNCDVDYSPTGSSSTARRAKITLENMGYKNTDKRIGFAEADIIATVNMIKANKPVYVAAHNFWGTKGHATVFDGYVERRKKTTTYTYYSDGTRRKSESFGESERLFHINWGYSGLCDGYYVAKSKLDDSERYANATDVEYTPGNYNISYSYNFRVVTYDLPNE